MLMLLAITHRLFKSICLCISSLQSTHVSTVIIPIFFFFVITNITANSLRFASHLAKRCSSDTQPDIKETVENATSIIINLFI